MRVRTRGMDRLMTEVMGYRFRYYNGVQQYRYPVPTPNFYPTFKVTVDETHPKYPYQGGPLDIREVDVTFSDAPEGLIGTFCAHPQNPTWKYTVGDAYYGRLRSLLTPMRAPTSDLSHTESLGPDAWNRFKPAKPVVGLGQSLAELKDVQGLIFQKLRFFKSTLKRYLEANRKVGGWYLAVQFGWRPMLNDILSLLDSIRRLDSQIADLRRANGKYQRKNGTLFNTTNEQESIVSGGIVPWTTIGPKTRIRMVTRDRAWFKGVFKYYIPGLDDPKWGTFNATRELWDLNITPELVWQMMPWSWLFDWASNVGSVISNFQSQISDQVVARYAYVMHEERTTTELRSTAKVSYNDVSVYVPAKTRSVNCSTLIEQCTKCRAEASPFGFGLSLPDFSAYQLSILGALGLSRMKW